MKPLITCVMCFTLSGCWMGCRFPFTEYGNVTVYDNQLCINGENGDVLSLYDLQSSSNQYKSPLLYSDEISPPLVYPDTCLEVELKGGYTYSLDYKLNNETYQFVFTKDLNGNIVIIKGVK